MSKGMDTDSRASADRARTDEKFTGRRIHLIGIGGSGMRALAGMLLGHGAQVSGSDMSPSGAVDRLLEQGADVHIGKRQLKGDRIACSCTTQACAPGNPAVKPAIQAVCSCSLLPVSLIKLIVQDKLMRQGIIPT